MPNADSVREKLQLFVVDQANYNQLDVGDLGEIYPALKIAWGGTEADALVKNFLLNVLTHCTNVKSLLLGSMIPFNDILAAMQPALSKLQKIHIGHYAEPSEACIPKDVGKNDIHVVVNDLPEDQIKALLTTLGKTQKLICIYVIHFEAAMLDLSVLFKSNVVRVHVQQMSSEQVAWSVDNYVGNHPLMYLHLSSYNLQGHVKNLSRLLFKNLPDLIHLSLIKMPYRYSSDPLYIRLHCLHILETEISFLDIKWLSELPQLKELSIYDQDVQYVKYLPTLGSLQKLKVRYVMIGIFCKGLVDGRFPNLVDLELISSSSESNEKLFAKAKVPKLESVKLSYHRDWPFCGCPFVSNKGFPNQA